MKKVCKRRLFKFLPSLGKKKEDKNAKKVKEEDSEVEENDKEEDDLKKKIVKIKNSVSRNKKYPTHVIYLRAARVHYLKFQLRHINSEEEVTYYQLFMFLVILYFSRTCSST